MDDYISSREETFTEEQFVSFIKDNTIYYGTNPLVPETINSMSNEEVLRRLCMLFDV